MTQDLFAVEQADEITPVQTRSYIDSYMGELISLFSDFFQQIKVERDIPTPPQILTSLGFLNHLHQGRINFLFCPLGLTVVDLNAFFKKYDIHIKFYRSNRGPNISQEQLTQALYSYRTQEKWLVYNEVHPLSDWSHTNQRLDIGISAEACNLPEVVFFLAYQVYRQKTQKIISSKYSPAYIKSSAFGDSVFYVALTDEGEVRIAILPKDILSFSPLGEIKI